MLNPTVWIGWSDRMDVVVDACTYSGTTLSSLKSCSLGLPNIQYFEFSTRYSKCRIETSYHFERHVPSDSYLRGQMCV